MSICAVLTCKNKGTHTFPTDETLRRQWIKATRVDVQRQIGWNLRKHSSVCSDHFTASDFQMHGKLKRLKKAAVPSNFPWAPMTSQIDICQPDLKVNLPIDVPPEDPYEVHFNPSKANRSYARDVPITFVEEYPSLNVETAETDDIVDPFQNIGDTNECAGMSASTVTDERACKELTTCDVNKPKLDKEISYCDKILQTDDPPAKGPFSVYHYHNSDSSIQFYTGLETLEKLSFVYNTLGDCSNLKYYYNTSPNAKLDPFEQFFIALSMLRRHTEFQDISNLCMITDKEVTDIFITWVRFMALQWRNLDFNVKYPLTRIILDATECLIHRPGLTFAHQVTFSSCKSRNTLKFLVGIDPTGLITYVSPCNGGSATDKEILERSNLLDRFDDDAIMADKGLNIQDMVMSNGVEVDMPMLSKKGDHVKSETLDIDVESVYKRVIGMFKNYEVLKGPMNHIETILASDIVFVCAMLVNFTLRPPT